MVITSKSVGKKVGEKVISNYIVYTGNFTNSSSFFKVFPSVQYCKSVLAIRGTVFIKLLWRTVVLCIVKNLYLPKFPNFYCLIYIILTIQEVFNLRSHLTACKIKEKH